MWCVIFTGSHCSYSLQLLQTIAEDTHMEAIFYCCLNHPVFIKVRLFSYFVHFHNAWPFQHCDILLSETIQQSKVDKEPKTIAAGILSNKIVLKFQPQTEWDIKFDKESQVSSTRYICFISWNKHLIMVTMAVCFEWHFAVCLLPLTERGSG